MFDRCPFCESDEVTVLGVSGDGWLLTCGRCDRQWNTDDRFRLVLW